MLTTVTTNPTSAPSSKITSTDSSCVDYASCVVDASSDYDDGITKTTINIAVSPKSGNVPSKFARHVRELMFQNARTIGNVSRVWQYKQDANQGSTAAVEARVVLGITMQVSGIVVILWVAERVLFYCSSFT